MKRFIALCALTLALLFGTTAMPAGATSQGGGPINLPYCTGTWWAQDYGPDWNGSGTPWGNATSRQYPANSCWRQVKIYYTDGSGGHWTDSGWWSSNVTWQIPAGAHMVLSDHNFWNLQYNYVSGYRQYATWHA